MPEYQAIAVRSIYNAGSTTRFFVIMSQSALYLESVLRLQIVELVGPRSRP
jgi:hypothetical protein